MLKQEAAVGEQIAEAVGRRRNEAAQREADSRINFDQAIKNWLGLLILLVPVAIFFTLGAIGYFDPPRSVDRIEAHVRQLELEAAEARRKAERMVSPVPDSELFYRPAPELSDSIYMEIERPLVTVLNGSDKRLRIKFAIKSSANAQTIQNMKKHQIAVHSAMIDALLGLKESSLSKPNFANDLAEKLKTVANNALQKYEGYGGVEELIFTEFEVQ